MADKEVEIKVTTEVEASELDSLQDALDNAQSSAENLTDTLTNTDDEIEELGESAETAGESAEQLNDSLSSIDGEGLSSATSEASGLAEELDNATTSADSLGESLSVIEASSFMGAADSVGQYAQSAENLAQEMNTASISVGQLATNTGVAEPQMVSLINHISNATFPQQEAMAYVNALNQMGVAANDLGSAATNMDKINDATGIGYQKTMQLTQGLQAVGVSADQLPSAFNAIAYAQANVNGGADTLTRVLKTQASTINEYGLNVDQLVVIMQKLSEQGVSSQKMGRELSSILKENNGDLSAVEQQLGLTTGSLTNASQATSQYSGQLQELANEEAEHKTWLDQIGAAYEDLQLSLSPVLNPMASLIGLVGQVGNFGLAVKGIKELISTMSFLREANIVTAASEILLGIAEWFAASPILILAAIILILIAALVYLYYTNEDVRNAINALGQAFIEFGQWIYTTIQNAIQAFINFLTYIASLPGQVRTYLQNMINSIISWGASVVSHFLNTGIRSVNNFMNYIRSLPGKLQQELNNMLSAVGRWAATLPQKFWQAGVDAVKNFLAALGIASPGTMQRKLITEIEDTGDRIPDASQKLIRNIGLVGSEIVDSFGDPSLNVGFVNDQFDLSNNRGAPSDNSTYVFNLYGDIDNEERMEKFVEAVRREISWNNMLAGRTRQ